jgi:hypothetical protein
MPIDPKAAEARKKIEELLKSIHSNKADCDKLGAVIKEGNALKGDKDNPD